MYREKNFGFTLIFLGVCFLWEPVIGVADVLPDLLGWLFVCLGVSSLADLNEDLADAQKLFRRMLWVSLARVAAELLIYVFFGNNTDPINPYEAPVWTLLLAFSFSVLEILFLLPASRSFWRGISLLSECGGARNSMATPNRKGRNLCDRMLTVSIIFVIAHAVLTVLPEFSVLTVFQQENAYNTAVFRFRDLFRIVAGGLSGIVGLIFLTEWIRFFRVWRREVAWLGVLRARYEREILPDTGLLFSRRIGSGIAFFRVGVLLCANLSLLYYEFLPDWGCVLVVLCGCMILGTLIPGCSMTVGLGLSVAVVGIPRTLLNVRYLRSYVPKDSLWIPQAYECYLPIKILASIEAVLTALFICSLLICLFRMAKRYSAKEDALMRASTSRELRSLRKKAYGVVVFTTLSAGGKIAEAFLQPQYGWVWLIQFALSMVTFVLFNGFLTDVAELVTGANPPGRPAER